MKNSYSRFSFRCFIPFVPFVFLLTLFICFLAAPVQAEVFTVNNVSDDVPGSLRAAIASADSYDDVISFDVTGTITLSSELVIYTGMKIQGPGADLLNVSSGGNCRVFYIEDTAESVDISGISIVSGDAGANHGGGIYNLSDSLTVENCHFSGNHAWYGGGMCNLSSNPTVTNCTFSGNSATSGGGGMYSSSSSIPTVTNCTFSGNSSAQGSGMYNYSSSPTLTNCTFSGNSSDREGGGMCNRYSSPTVTNCTFSGNSASFGAGMYSFNSTSILTNCIFWDIDSEICNDDSTTSLNYCVVQSNDYGVASVLYVTSADPELEPLADNGGPTWTCGLGAGSSAIDAGTTVEEISTDQRGAPRPYGDSFDIGAYEYGSFLITVSWTGGGAITPGSADVSFNESVSFTVSPDINYFIEGVYIDGTPISFEPVDDVFIYTFENVSDNHVISADFQPGADDDTANGELDGCNISALSGMGLLLILPLMFLSGKIKYIKQ